MKISTAFLHAAFMIPATASYAQGRGDGRPGGGQPGGRPGGGTVSRQPAGRPGGGSVPGARRDGRPPVVERLGGAVVIRRNPDPRPVIPIEPPPPPNPFGPVIIGPGGYPVIDPWYYNDSRVIVVPRTVEIVTQPETVEVVTQPEVEVVQPVIVNEPAPATTAETKTEAAPVVKAAPVKAGDYQLVLLADEDENATPAVCCKAGQDMKFTFSVNKLAKTPVEGKLFLKWKRSGDDGRTESGRTEISADQAVSLVTSIDRPGFVRIEASLEDEAWTTVTAEIDTDNIRYARARLNWERDRHPELYGIVSDTNYAREGLIYERGF